MFYSFKVDEHHRDYLRFLWHEQNDINKPLTEYRMCVHIFGNTASPSIASYGLKQSAMRSNLGSDVTHFVLNDFYVDDGLTSLPTATEAVNLLKKTQEALITEGKLRLHKIASNNKEVMEAFPPEDLAKNLENLKLTDQALPVQHSLGIRWSLDSDTFSFDISTEDRPYSRRGVLSTINYF
ncbi:Hypothetical predicted protein [Mytilus galloprovincialis]|uniref:Uncharacterized protein n=1 Tax=Mytilus galloprovincialis TaxID=29158 RepID=A0A8B6GND7_MYTGA|nr:Hypothetical predicted protein [Mytilus galloprovincialis]